LSRNEKFKIQNLILPGILYGCEIWSLTLREENRLRAFENRVLKRVFGPKKDEVTGEWRKLQTEELHNLYSTQNINRKINSWRMRWVVHVASIGIQLAQDRDWWQALENAVMKLKVRPPPS
jgi:hypothetical protein